MINGFHEVASPEKYPYCRKWVNGEGAEIYQFGYGRGNAYLRIESGKYVGAYKTQRNAAMRVRNGFRMTKRGIRNGGCFEFLWEHVMRGSAVYELGI